MHAWHFLPLLLSLPFAELFSIIFIGDWGCDCQTQKAVASGMARLCAHRHIDYVVTLGDNFFPYGISNVTDPRWNETFEWVYSQPPLAPVHWLPILGEHDWQSPDLNAYFDRQQDSNRWRHYYYYYSIDHTDGGKSVMLVFLDTMMLLGWYNHSEELDLIASQQPAWVERVISNSTADWILVFGHHPIYSAGRYSGVEELARMLNPLMQRHGVAAYFSAHDHQMHHFTHQGLEYFIMGNSGQSNWKRRAYDSPPRGSARYYTSGGGFGAVHVIDASTLEVSFYSKAPRRVYCYRVANPRRTTAGGSRVCPRFLEKQLRGLPAESLRLAAWLYEHAVAPIQIQRIIANGTTTLEAFANLTEIGNIPEYTKWDRPYIEYLRDWLQERSREENRSL